MPNWDSDFPMRQEAEAQQAQAPNHFQLVDFIWLALTNFRNDLPTIHEADDETSDIRGHRLEFGDHLTTRLPQSVVKSLRCITRVDDNDQGMPDRDGDGWD